MVTDLPFERESLKPDGPEAVDDLTIDTAVDVLVTMQDNGLVDDTVLEQIGRRIVSLIHHGGLTPSEAKAKAATERLHPQHPLTKIASLLGISKSGVSKLKTQAYASMTDASRLRVMTIDHPLNIIAEMSFSAEPPADYEEQYFLLEVAFPEDKQYVTTSRGPDIEPPTPKYAVYVETFAPGRFGHYSGSELAYYNEASDLVDALYEEKRFQSEERAAEWRRWLEACGFTVQSTPAERVNPDVKE